MIALTGATGFVGGALRARMVADGRDVRCLSRSGEALEGCETVRADVVDRASLDAALAGVESAYYLVHALGDEEDFAETEARGARTFAEAADAAGVRKIVYLGGLAHGEELSEHMASRQEVGRILSGSRAEVVELRASIVLGEGSFSFELLRDVVDALPLLPLPSWVEGRCQPIAVADLVQYLVEALDAPPGVYEIGGADVVSYRDLLSAYADATGAARLDVAVPSLGMPVPQALARRLPTRARTALKLVESLGTDSTVRAPAAGVFDVRPLGVRAAIRAALDPPA